MRRNPHTRNIFTAEGRLNRRIDKYNKTVGLINKLDEILEHIVNKVDNNMGIPIDKINEKINQEIIANEEKEECVICCEGCSHEFNILDNSIKKIHVNNTENISTTDTKYVCPKCGFQNEIDFDNESNEDDLDICEDDCNCDDKKCDLCEDMNKDEILSINSKRINIKKGIKKSRKIIINKTIPFKIIHDEEIISGIDIALNHGSVSESIEMLKNKNIDITKNSTDNSKSYCTNTGFITFIHGENDNNMIDSFIIKTRLNIIPHGNLITLYDNILSQLGIEKIDEKYKSIGMDGKACIIKLNDGTLAACNFYMNNNDLIITIIYNIDN